MAPSQPENLYAMATGYFRSRALCAAARLGVADAIGDTEQHVADLATACNAHPESLYRLLRALASFGIVTETQPRTFALTPMGQKLRKDAPETEWHSIIFWGDLLADCWSYLTECVQKGEPARSVTPPGVTLRWAQNPDAPAIFRAVMGTGPTPSYLPLASAWDFSHSKTVADLGGGGGALIAAILQTCPNTRGMLVDRQDAVERAKPRFDEEGLAGRCQFIGVDLTQEVPPGADTYTMQHVLHGYADDMATKVLQNCKAVLLPGGRLLIIEFVVPDTVAEPDPELEGRLMSDLNMLAVTGGKERSGVEWKELLENAGLKFVRIISVPGMSPSIIEASL